MTTDIARRKAFAQAFKDYPDYLERFVTDHCDLVGPNGGDVLLTSSAPQNAMMQICMAQFLTRIIRTRCNNSTPDLAGFGMETAGRYNDLKKRLIGDMEIMTEEKYQRALNAIEQNMANLIFQALAEEAAIDLQSNAPGTFDEIDFWIDVISAFKLTQKSHHPIWNLALNKVFLNHASQFRRALKSEVETAGN